MSLAQQAVRGAAWTMALNMAGRAIGLLGTLVLTRYLAPSQVGEVGVAVGLITTANYFSLLGMGHYIASKPDASREAAFHSTIVTLVFGALAIGVALLTKDWAAPKFGAPAAARFLPGMAIAMALDRIAFIPTRVLVRDMRFRTAGLVRTAGEVVFPIVAVSMALQGYGGEALVAANVVRAAVRTMATIAVVNWREWLEPHRPNMAVIREILGFGLPNWVASMAAFAASSWDVLLMARLFGPGESGYYQLAYQLAILPAVQIGDAIADVLLPSYARLPADRRGPALAQTIRLLVLIMFPLSLGLAAMGPTIVATFLGPGWAPIGAHVAILAVVSAVYPIGYAVTSSLNAANQPRSVMWLSVLRTVALLGSMAFLGIVVGPLAACAAVGVAYGLHALLGVAIASRHGQVAPVTVFRAMVRPLAACVPMVAAVLLARHGLASAGIESRAAYLIVEVVAGALTYVVAAFLLAPQVSRELIGVLSKSLLRRRPATAPAVT